MKIKYYIGFIILRLTHSNLTETDSNSLSIQSLFDKYLLHMSNNMYIQIQSSLLSPSDNSAIRAKFKDTYL